MKSQSLTSREVAIPHQRLGEPPEEQVEPRLECHLREDHQQHGELDA